MLIFVMARILFRALCCQGRFLNVGLEGGGQEEKEKGGKRRKRGKEFPLGA